MDPNKGRMLKTIFFKKKDFALKARIAKITEKFDGDTQKIRGDLILDLKVIAEMVHDQATKIEKGGRPTKDHQKWAQLAAYISRVIGQIAKEYDAAKIREQLDELMKRAAELERETGI